MDARCKRAEDALQELTSELEERVAQSGKAVNPMAGHEVRMAELKGVIRQLRSQLEQAGLTPAVDEPLAPKSWRLPADGHRSDWTLTSPSQRLGPFLVEQALWYDGFGSMQGLTTGLGLAGRMSTCRLNGQKSPSHQLHGERGARLQREQR